MEHGEGQHQAVDEVDLGEAFQSIPTDNMAWLFEEADKIIEQRMQRFHAAREIPAEPQHQQQQFYEAQENDDQQHEESPESPAEQDYSDDWR